MMALVIIPGPGEPDVDDWHPLPFAGLVAELVQRLGEGRRVLAVDGRSAGGKSTLAARLAEVIAASAVVSTDDVAWHESMFGWSGLLRDGVLRPFRTGSAVTFRPPAWERRGRDGVIEVAADVRVLIIEGVGASCVDLAPWLDLALWVRSDSVEAERRGIARDVASGVNGDAAETVAFWHEWQAAEQPFLLRDRPWERADAIVSGVSAESSGEDDLRLVRWQHGST